MDDMEELDDPEEFELEPLKTYTNTGVVCARCGAVHMFKRHISKGVYSPHCPKCRRKDSNRAAAVRYAARAAREAIVAEAMATRRHHAVLKQVKTRITKLSAQAKQQAGIFQRKIDNDTASARTIQAMARRKAQLAYYERVRERMLADVATNQLKPTEHYLQDEELYATYKYQLANSIKPTTPEQETDGSDVA